MESFGKYLTQQRELRAMSRKDVVRVTRVSLEHFVALEEDRFDDLPGDVFAIGYIRSYARCIGLNPDETVLRYQEVRRAAQPIPEPPRRASRGGLWIFLFLVAAAAAGVGVWFFEHHQG